MSLTIDTKEYLDTVCDLLREGRQNVCVPVRGSSMRPFLRDQDLVYLNLLTAPVRPGDVLLFQRPNGQYILHRVYRCLSDGTFLMLGDSQTVLERIRPAQVLAVVSFARIRNKPVTRGSFRWWFYAHPWRLLAPVRGWIGRLHRLIKHT